MAVNVIAGAQWGDEGKGKLTHLVAQDADLVVRVQGGDNAGHTVKCGEEEHKFRLLPSGIIRKGVRCLLDDEVKVNPLTLVDELSKIPEDSRGELWVSRNAHIILPYHVFQDVCSEKQKGRDAIGTTLRGMGPAQADHRFRSGLRMADMLAAGFEVKVKEIARRKNKLFEGYYGERGIDPDALWETIKPTIEVIGPMVTDTTWMMRQAIEADARIWVELAQGVLLDIDYGTYPFVTSSTTTVAAALIGTGINYRELARTMGVAKGYCTRVGAGPFPTRAVASMEIYLRERGDERGTVTNRDRGCGWLDLPLLRYACILNGFTELAITKMDVLDELMSIPVCVAHRLPDGTESIWPDMHRLGEVTPVYVDLPGWTTSTRGLTDISQAPPEYREYLALIQKFCGVPINIVSTGPKDIETAYYQATGQQAAG